MNAILKEWWVLTIKGILTFTFGLLVISTQIGSAIVLARVFAILLLLSGLLLVVISFREKKKFGDRSWRLTEGFIDIIMGLIIISFSEITTSVFLSLVAIWISFMGILLISNGYRLRRLYNHCWILTFNGILAIGFAIMVFTQPIHGIITTMVIIGLQTIVFGLQTIVFGGFLIISSFYIRKIFRDINTEIPHKIGEDANQELSYY
jgi:uncharacterized membrane protein HdeD (DUF308 family)